MARAHIIAAKRDAHALIHQLLLSAAADQAQFANDLAIGAKCANDKGYERAAAELTAAATVRKEASSILDCLARAQQ